MIRKLGMARAAWRSKVSRKSLAFYGADGAWLWGADFARSQWLRPWAERWMRRHGVRS